MALNQKKIIKVLKTIEDPTINTPINVYDLGLIREIDVNIETSYVKILMTLTDGVNSSMKIMDEIGETINNMEEDLTSKIRNINNNMNVSMDELKDSVDIDISDLDDRLNNIDKKLEDLEKYLDNINCEQVEMNNRLEYHEIGINQLFKKFKKLDNLNNKSNNEGSK